MIMIGEVFKVCLPDSKDPIYLKDITVKKRNNLGTQKLFL